MCSDVFEIFFSMLEHAAELIVKIIEFAMINMIKIWMRCDIERRWNKMNVSTFDIENRRNAIVIFRIINEKAKKSQFLCDFDELCWKQTVEMNVKSSIWIDTRIFVEYAYFLLRLVDQIKWRNWNFFVLQNTMKSKYCFVFQISWLMIMKWL